MKNILLLDLEDLENTLQCSLIRWDMRLWR